MFTVDALTGADEGIVAEKGEGAQSFLSGRSRGIQQALGVLIQAEFGGATLQVGEGSWSKVNWGTEPVYCELQQGPKGKVACLEAGAWMKTLLWIC